jgi:hypothetical protein
MLAGPAARLDQALPAPHGRAALAALAALAMPRIHNEPGTATAPQDGGARWAPQTRRPGTVVPAMALV